MLPFLKIKIQRPYTGHSEEASCSNGEPRRQKESYMILMVRDTANDHSEPTEAEQSATVNEELSSEIGLHALTARVTSRCFMAF